MSEQAERTRQYVSIAKTFLTPPWSKRTAFMAKDYKNSPKPKDKPRKSSDGLPGWGWLIIGILVAVVVMKGAPKIWQRFEHRLHPGVLQAAKTPAKSLTQARAAATAPHFDFYKL